MRRFLILWSGQTFSALGSAVTGFGLGVWVYQKTGTVTTLSLVVTAATAPGLLALPLAGVVADRYSRRAVLAISDAVAALTTVVIAALVLADRVQVWHVAVLVGVSAIANTFQNPAWIASIPMLVPKHHLGRASGLGQLRQGLAAGLSPVIAGAMLLKVGILGILIADFVTFVVAIVTLVCVPIPQPPRRSTESSFRRSLVADAVEGARYLKDRPGLLRLLAVFGVSAFLVAFTNVLWAPLMLSFSNEAALGFTISTGAVGMVLGSIAVTWLGVPKRKVQMTLGGLCVGGLLLAMTGLRESVGFIVAIIFGTMLLLPVARGSDRVLWQTKLAPEIQGRVFALRRLLVRSSAPLAYLLAGPLADMVFEPLMAERGPLAGSLGRVIGVGPGRGIALMFILIGLMTASLAALAYVDPRVRRIERELPDQPLNVEPEKAANSAVPVV